LNFEDCLVLEYRLALAACAYGEFREGVRALIVDKDNAPKWSHAAIEDVPEADVLNQFNAPTVGDLTF
jgi:enoyl-CoA hydratase